MEYTTIKSETSENGELVTITLDRPQAMNAMTLEMMSDLLQEFRRIEVDPKARVVILKGNQKAKAFCAGADLKANALGIGGTKWNSSKLENQEKFGRVIRTMARIPQPIICGVHGAAAGGGFALSLGCDIRIAAESTKFNAAFISIGLSGCELGTSFHLPKIIGLSNANYFLMTDDKIRAQDALRMNLVSKVVPDEELGAECERVAKACLNASKLGLQITKLQLRGSADGISLEQALHAENAGQVLCLNDSDTKEYTAKLIARYLPKKGKL